MIKLLYWTCTYGALAIYKTLFKFKVIGKENVDKNKQYVVCANHSNWQDPVVMASVLPFVIRFMAKKELFKAWIVSKFLTGVGVFPVDRDSNDLKAIKKALSLLKNGENLGLFPEGTRNKSNKPLPVKSGVVLMALKTQTPILPITIDSSFKLFSPLTVTIHPSVDLSSHYQDKVDSEKLEQLATDIMSQIYGSKKYFDSELDK